MGSPLVSVVMPVYNAERWLSRSLDGVLGQTMGDLELIAVDDASTDGSAAVLRRYARRDPRVRVIGHDANLYAGAARNDGLDAAAGEYVLFLDADDEFEPGLLERAAGRAQETGADAVLFGADEFEGEGGPCRENPFYLDRSLLPPSEPFSRNDVPDRLFQLCTPEPWTKLFRRSFIEDRGLRFQGSQNANDLYFTMAALAEAPRVAVVPDALVHHRVGLGSSVQGRRSREPLAFLGALRALRARLDGEGLLPALRGSFAELAVFHCLYNSDAPVGWARAFVELGVAGVAASDFCRPRDYGRYLDLVVDSWDGESDLSAYGEGFWREAALRGRDRAAELREREAWAMEELDRVKGSLPLRLGLALTWLPRKAKKLLRG